MARPVVDAPHGRVEPVEVVTVREAPAAVAALVVGSRPSHAAATLDRAEQQSMANRMPTSRRDQHLRTVANVAG